MLVNELFSLLIFYFKKSRSTKFKIYLFLHVQQEKTERVEKWPYQLIRNGNFEQNAELLLHILTMVTICAAGNNKVTTVTVCAGG